MSSPQDADITACQTDAKTTGKRPMSKRKKIIIGVAAALLVVIIGVCTAFAVYFNNLGSNMSYDGDKSELEKVLVKADCSEPFYVLVVGSDHWEKYGARSDAMVLTRVDLKTPQITMLSIPRDTPYQINGKKFRLNEVFSQEGDAACIEAVSAVTGVGISHYVELEFDQLQNVVDSLGGVTVNVPYSFDYQVYTKDQPVVHVDKGKQTLNGEQAIALARMRTAYSPEGAGISEDAIRQANVRAMMVGVMKQVLAKPINELPAQIANLANMVKTDIPLNDLISWAKDLAGADKVTLYTSTGPTEGGLDADAGVWLVETAPQKWKEIMEVVDSGGDPSALLDVKESNDGVVKLGQAEVLDN